MQFTVANGIKEYNTVAYNFNKVFLGKGYGCSIPPMHMSAAAFKPRDATKGLSVNISFVRRTA
jgi:hypothetical protein